MGLVLISGLVRPVAADTCPVPLFREYRPGPWPPALLTDPPVRSITDTPHVDPDPTPAGRWLTFYRVAEPFVGEGSEPLLFVERSGALAVLHWGGGGDPVGCCLDGDCLDTCRLECLAEGGSPADPGSACSDVPSACAVDPCGTFLDFTADQVPLPWIVLDRDGDTNETTRTTTMNERLEASPVNDGQRVEAAVALPPGTTAVTIEFDSQHLSSQWGCYAEVQLHGPTGAHFVLARNAIFSEGANTMELWTGGPAGTEPTTVVSIEHGPHHHRMRLTDDLVEREVWDLTSGTLVADVVQDLPGFRVADLGRLVWEVYVTTDNPTWGDDFKVECEP